MKDTTQLLESQHPLPTSVPEGLGTLYEVTQPPPDDRLPASNRYARQDVARYLLPSHRVASCLRVRQCSTDVKILQGLGSDGQTVYAYSGLMVCGSVWACPVCAAKVTRHRKHELQAAVTVARNRGYHVYLMTQTVRHTVRHDLQSLADGIQQARRLFANRKAYRRVVQRVGLIGSVRALEVTVGEGNGWHVHYHELLFTQHELTPDEVHVLKVAWCEAVETTGLPRPGYARGLDIRFGEDADSYLAKWGVTNEITGGEAKESSTNYQPFALLDLVDQGHVLARLWFVEYVNVMKGRSQIRWSKGLRDLLGLGATLSDQEAAEQVDIASEKVVISIAVDTWRQLCRQGWRYQLLRLCYDLGPQVADYWLSLDLDQQLDMLHKLRL